VSLSSSALSALAIAAAAVAVLSLLLVLLQGRQLRRVRRRRSLPSVRASTAQVPLNGDVGAELAELRDMVAHSVQCVGLVRFDAYEDMGGHLSFAAALLDADGSGIVLSSINGRNESRIYAKSVERGASRHNLSTEEQEAIRRAIGAVTR